VPTTARLWVDGSKRFCITDRKKRFDARADAQGLLSSSENSFSTVRVMGSYGSCVKFRNVSISAPWLTHGRVQQSERHHLCRSDISCSRLLLERSDHTKTRSTNTNWCSHNGSVLITQTHKAQTQTQSLCLCHRSLLIKKNI
jgi:hypothetical protein